VSRLRRTDLTQPDGRRVSLYGAYQAAPPDYRAPSIGEGAYQRRWNALRREWVLVAAARQDRSFLPRRSKCPLCPSSPGHSTEIPASRYQLAVFENRFPALRDEGVCEVVVYTDAHEGALATLPEDRLDDLAEVWTDRYRVLAARPDVDYVFIFENRGEAVGVTLQHPHGQIYGYPFVPPIAALELRPDRHECRVCALIAGELEAGVRVLIHEGGLAAYVPVFARWPYEVHVATLTHVGALPDLPAPGRRHFARILQRLARAYDRLFRTPMPYMMVLHQRPTDGRDHPQAHLHAEIYPILRDRGRLKYLAGSESGAGVFINDTLAEETAARLRAHLA
jgi:UDPglucose--hexose-1-phosphate uridylyltransferase